MDLNDKARSNPDVELARDLIESEWSLKSTELTGADELTPEGEFPQYGDFAEAHEFSPVDGTNRGERYIEIPAALAQWLVENEIGVGDRFQVKQVQKVDGEYQFDVEPVDGDE